MPVLGRSGFKELDESVNRELTGNIEVLCDQQCGKCRFFLVGAVIGDGDLLVGYSDENVVIGLWNSAQVSLGWIEPVAAAGAG